MQHGAVERHPQLGAGVRHRRGRCSRRVGDLPQPDLPEVLLGARRDRAGLGPDADVHRVDDHPAGVVDEQLDVATAAAEGERDRGADVVERELEGAGQVVAGAGRHQGDGPTSRSSPRSCRHCATAWTVPSPPTTTTRRPSAASRASRSSSSDSGCTTTASAVRRSRSTASDAAPSPPARGLARTRTRLRRGVVTGPVWRVAGSPRLARSWDDRSRRAWWWARGWSAPRWRWAMARQGRSVEVVDRGPGPGYGSTSASSAIVRFNYSTFAGVALSWDARAAWEVWPEHLGHRDPDGVATFTRCGLAMLDVEDLPWQRSAALFDAGRGAPTSTGTPRPSPTACPASTPDGGSRRARSPTTRSSTTPPTSSARSGRRTPATSTTRGSPRRTCCDAARARGADSAVRARRGVGRASCPPAGGGCGSTTAPCWRPTSS